MIETGLEKAIGDAEVTGMAAWTDTAADERWKTVDQASQLRAFDRFHREPDAPEFSSSWAEWLYFNGRTSDGRVRFYLTFIVGPKTSPGFRSAGVRLQLDREGTSSTYVAPASVDERLYASTLAIIGSGVQAHSHLEAISLVRPLKEVRVWSPTLDRCQRFAAEARARVRATVTAAVDART